MGATRADGERPASPGRDRGGASVAAADHTQTEIPGSGASAIGRRAGSSAGTTTPRREPRDRPASMGVGDEAALPVDDPDRYESLSEYARGGLGRIIRARDLRLGRMVAIKELHRTSELAESLFVREALITARLQHPGIVPVHEAGRWPSGEPYYVMKLVSGRTLKELIEERGLLSERLALLPNAIAVAETMAYAHSEHVIHRDLKPANIMVGEFGETVIVDWGLARDARAGTAPSGRAASDGASDQARSAGATTGSTSAGATTGSTSAGATTGSTSAGATTAGATTDNPPTTTSERSVSGKVVGTPAYMSPEQARGERVDARSDVYALGAVLYELLTGAPPYRGHDPEAVIARVLSRPPAPVARRAPGAPPDLIAIVAKAMARDPADRYPTACELAEDLKRFQTGQLVSAHSYTAASLLRRWVRRHAGEVAVASIGLVVLAVVAGMAVRRVIAERNDARAAQLHAQEAQGEAEQRGQELLLQQAESSVDRDPTAALAWLKQARVDGEAFGRARAVVRDALSRGVAAHVLRHPGWATSAGFAPEIGRVVTSSDDGMVWLWDTATWRVVATHRHIQGVARVAFSPDRSLIGIGGARGSVGVWSPETGIAHASPVLRGPVTELAFSPDARWLYASERWGDAARWDLGAAGTIPVQVSAQASAGASRLAQFPGDGRVARMSGTRTLVLDAPGTGGGRAEATGGGRPRAGAPAPGLAPAPPRSVVLPRPVIDLAFSTDGGRVIATTRSFGLYAVRWATGEVVALADSLPRLWQVVSSPSGRYLAVAGEGSTVAMWDLDTGDRTVFHGPRAAVYTVAFTPDERAVIAAGDEGVAWVWDRRTGDRRTLLGHADDVWEAVVSPDGALLATASLDGSVRIWPLATLDGALVGTPGGALERVAVAEQDRAVTLARDGTVQVWDLAARTSRTLGAGDAGGDKPQLLVARDGRQVAVRRRHEIVLWDVDTGRETIAEVGADPASAIALSPRGDMLAVTGPKGTIRLLSLAPADGAAPDPGWSERARGGAWEVLAVSRAAGVAASGPASAAAFSPDGARLAAGYADGARVWDLATGREVAFAQLAGPTWSRAKRPQIRFSPDGRHVAMFTGDAVWLWRPGAAPARRLVSESYHVMDLVFSPDSRWLAVARSSREVTLWRTAGGGPRALRGHTDAVLAVLFSADSRAVISASHDTTVRIWDVATGESRALRGHDGPVKDAALLPGTTGFLTASEDGTVRRWDLAAEPIPDPCALTALLAEATSAVIGPGRAVVTPGAGVAPRPARPCE